MPWKLGNAHKTRLHHGTCASTVPATDERRYHGYLRKRNTSFPAPLRCSSPLLHPTRPRSIFLQDEMKSCDVWIHKSWYHWMLQWALVTYHLKTKWSQHRQPFRRRLSRWLPPSSRLSSASPQQYSWLGCMRTTKRKTRSTRWTDQTPERTSPSLTQAEWTVSFTESTTSCISPRVWGSQSEARQVQNLTNLQTDFSRWMPAIDICCWHLNTGSVSLSFSCQTHLRSVQLNYAIDLK